MSDKSFTVDAELCTKCGFCKRLCPARNIELVDGLPQWNGNCEMCLSCIHRCPVRAIEYGKATKRKGRYVFKKNQ